MEFAENIKNVEPLLKIPKYKVYCVGGNLLEYDAEIGMYYAMEAIACLVKIFSFTELKLDDFFGEEPKIKTFDNKFFAENITKAIVTKEAREAFYEAISYIIKKEVDWVKNNIDILSGIGVFYRFFESTSESTKYWMMMMTSQESTPVSLDSEKSSHGVSPTETSQ